MSLCSPDDLVHDTKALREKQSVRFAFAVDLNNRTNTTQFVVDALLPHTVSDPTYEKQGKQPCAPTCVLIF